MTGCLEGRVALVTGGSRGIGRAIAEALGGGGAAVAVNYRERNSDAASAVEAIARSGSKAVAMRADVACARALDAMMYKVRQALGPIDILVNNAGIAPRRDLEDTGEADFDETIAINLKSAFLCTQAVLPHMRAQKWGRVINLSSIAARTAMANTGISVMYNVTKAGIEGLTRGHAARVAADGVTVNAIAPGLIDTDLGRPLVESGATEAIPVGRSGTAEEIAATAMMLVKNGFITGQTIAVNGGRLYI